jgi:predicted branched-subunit amino acid permease
LKNDKQSSVKAMSLGVGFATGLYGISFGALATASGFTVLQASMLSVFMFSGASQFAFVGVIASGGLAALPAAITGAWLLGVRNGFYAIRLAPVLQVHGATKLLAAQLTIDESNAVANAQSQPEMQKKGFWFTGIAVFIFWNLATLFGAWLGSVATDSRAWGLDAAAAAAFLGLLWPKLKGKQTIGIAVAAFLVATISIPIVPSGVPVLLAACVAIVVGARSKTEIS